MPSSETAVADLPAAHDSVLTDIYRHVVHLQQQVDSWTQAHAQNGPPSMAAPPASQPVSWFRYFWHLLQGALLLGTCLAAAGWVLWKQFGERWWYVQQQRSSQVIDDMSNEDLHRLLGGKHVPAWVNFPDFQRVQWVNDVIGQMWPRINAVATQRFHEFADPLIQQSKPSWVYQVEMQKCTFGDVPPRVDAVKIYKNVGPDDQVVMEYNFHWAGKQQMEMLMQPLPPTWGKYSPHTIATWASSLFRCKVAVEDIIADGRLRLAVQPVFDETQLAAALQISLVEMPSFSFNINVYGGDITFLPGVEKWINWFIETRVLRPYVLPERLTVPVKFLYDPTLETDKDWAGRPEGMLFVRLIEANNVPRMDWFRLMRSDPFVILYTRHGRKMKSQVKHNTTSPEWNEDFRFLVHVPGQQYLNGELKDWDRLSASDEIGRFKVAIADLAPGQETDMWVELEPSDHKKHIRNHSEFHENLDEKPKASGSFQGDPKQRRRKRRNSDPPVVGTPAGPDAQMNGQAFQHDGMDQDGMDADLHDGARHQEAGRDAFRPMHARQSRYEADGHASHVGKVRWGRMSPQPGEQDYQASPTTPFGVTPRREGETHRPPDQLRRQSLAQGLRQEGANRLEQIGSQLGINQPCKVHMKLTYHAFGSEELRAAIEGARRPGRQPSHQVNPNDSEAIKFLKGGVLYVHLIKAIDVAEKPKYKGGFLATRLTAKVTVGNQMKYSNMVKGRNHDQAFDETLEFVLAADEIHEGGGKLDIELWDYKFRNHCMGLVAIPLAEILHKKTVKNTYQLDAAKHGQLQLEVRWMSILNGA